MISSDIMRVSCYLLGQTDTVLQKRVDFKHEDSSKSCFGLDYFGDGASAHDPVDAELRVSVYLTLPATLTLPA